MGYHLADYQLEIFELADIPLGSFLGCVPLPGQRGCGRGKRPLLQYGNHEISGL